MKITRHSIFETNSSSTHVLTIVKNGKYKLPEKLRFDFGEFGWEKEVYTDTNSKASYLITLIFEADDKYKDEWLDRLSKILDSHNIQYTYPVPHKDQWGYMSQGYVDHCDEAFAWVEYVLSDENKLFSFLFDERSYISTSNDNDLGYYYPGIGYDDDYYPSKSKELEDKLNKLKESHYIYWKGN